MLGPKDVISLMPESKQREMEAIAVRIADHFKDFTDAELKTRARAIITDFATQAWRGQLSREDQKGLFALFDHELDSGKSFDAAVKLPLVAVLSHPQFIYRLQASDHTEASYQLSNSELASKLSFALWGSIPMSLIAAANQDALDDPSVLQEQAVRMLKDGKGRRLAEDFAGYWLGYEGFDQHSGVDKETFKAFDGQLRDAMYREVVEFLDHLFREGSPLTDALDADYAFVNEKLAKHYDIDGVRGGHFRKVALPAERSRGGVATMGAFLTKNSKPLRTSQVLRGAWILESVLGEHIPAPPDNIPLLSDAPQDEHGRTLLEQLRDPPRQRLMPQLPRAHGPTRRGHGKLRPHRRLAHTSTKTTCHSSPQPPCRTARCSKGSTV